ncbi:MAG: zinc ribbon domain-containing protein [Anaerolineae bacterium]|nr:zinc ribbon domain-containing protein [Anaerolineae bacterium]
MPMYDFRCKECGHAFTVRASFKEKDAGLQPECPVCYAVETQQVLTVGVVIGQVAGGDTGSLPLPMMSGPACGCGSGGCGCG